jgi:outer membrane receptor protein involved in Fe transport
MKSQGGWRWGGSYRAVEPYWPGMFINFNCKKDSGAKEDSANFVIRGDELGRDVAGPVITQTGWWTLGISFSANGQANYYIKAGVGNLTEKDHVVSYFPYGYHAELLETFFFDIVNMDDGKSWSTPWIVDDPMVYVAR